jgi:hypothetical protein
MELMKRKAPNMMTKSMKVILLNLLKAVQLQLLDHLTQQAVMFFISAHSAIVHFRAFAFWRSICYFTLENHLSNVQSATEHLP